MNLEKNTILITGGGSGIGLAIAKALAHRGNKIIITGRNPHKLRKAIAEIPYSDALICDITDADQVNYLVTKIKTMYPGLNILINNAGAATNNSLGPAAGAYEKASVEFATNVLGIIRLTEELLPILSTQKNSAIVNVGSALAFAPSVHLPTYSASKSALHSYTQSLRSALRDIGTKVYELMPPLVDTDLSRDMQGTRMTTEEVAIELIEGIKNDIYEIHPGLTAALYDEFLSSPESAFKIVNRLRD